MKYLYWLLLLTALPVAAKLDNAYLTSMTEDYVTPGYLFQPPRAPRPLRTLFILARPGARDAVEIVQRMPMEAEYFLTYNHAKLASDDVYENCIKATNLYEKEGELEYRLKQTFDIYVIGQYPFEKLPAFAQYQILRAVRQGSGLILVRADNTGLSPSLKQLYKTPLELPENFQNFAQPAQNAQIKAWQVGKGRFLTVCWQTPFTPSRSVLPTIPYSNQWKTQNENASAFFAMLCRFAAGKADMGKIKIKRLRDSWNQTIWETPDLPAGTYYRDTIADNGCFHIEKVEIPSAVGAVSIQMDEVVAPGKPIKGEIVLEKACPDTLKVCLELMDSPEARIWATDTLRLSSGKTHLAFQIKDYYMPNLAGYLRATLLKKDRKLAIAEHVVFFPSPGLEDYRQMTWDGLTGNNAELLAPQVIGRLGWNLGLEHPTPGGANARQMALLNQKMVCYTTRVMLVKSKEGGVCHPNWFFLPKDKQGQQSQFAGDECLYRPEVRQLWEEAILKRIENLPKYSTALYSLGDENTLDYEAGFGPSDLQYFREFLNEKYQNIETLNYNYHTTYKNFDEVPHLTMAEALARGNYPAWADHRAYMEKMYADFHAFLREVIRKEVPDALVGAEGSVPANLEQTISKLDFWGPYSNLVEDEVLSSFGRDKVRMLWWGGYPTSHGGRNPYPIPLLGDLLKGTVNGSAWFASLPGSNHGSFGCDYTIAKYLQNYLFDLDRMKYGTAQLLINNPVSHSRLGFYWSHASNTAAMLGSQFIPPQDGLGTLIRFAYRHGLGFQFVSERTLGRLKNTKLLFLCGASALSNKECLELFRYVREGGTIIADRAPAIFNENLRINERSPLADLFGTENFLTAKVASPSVVKIDGLTAERTPAVGKQFFVERQLGKGKAYLCNFSLSSACACASPQTPFDQWLLAILKKAGIAPEFQTDNQNENTIFRLRKGEDFDLLGVLVPNESMNTPIRISLTDTYHIYRVDNQYLGKDETITVSCKKTPLQIYALFSSKQKQPSLSVGNASQGDKLSISFPSLTPGRIYRLQITPPVGMPPKTFVFDRKDNCPHPHIPYNAPKGQWEAKLTDVATGLYTSELFTVK